RIASFDPTLEALIIPDNGLSEVSPFAPSNIPVVTASTAGYPAHSLIQTSKTDFYPRLGAAYKLTSDGKTVIRAGYGIYGDILYGGLISAIPVACLLQAPSRLPIKSLAVFLCSAFPILS